MKYTMKDAPVSIMTRQPTKGRANNGGLRIGEMEKDSILSHGMVAFLKESMMERSDKFNQIIGDSEKSTKVSTPYCFKQLVHELKTLSIDVKFKFGDDKETYSEDDEDDEEEEDGKSD